MASPLSERDWESAIKLLEKLGAVSGSGPSHATAAARKELYRLETKVVERLSISGPSARMTASNWSKVLKAKVPYRLAKACRQVLQSGHSPCTSFLSSLQTGAQVTALGATCWSPYSTTPVTWHLNALLYRAAEDGLIQQQTASVMPTQQTAAIAQQIYDSGLLQLLPQLMADAGRLLQAGIPSPNPISGHASSSSPMHGGSSSSGSSSSSSRTAAAGGAGASAASQISICLFSADLMRPAESVLKLYAKLQSCWRVDGYTPDIVPGCAEPVLSLVLRAFQYASLFLADNADPPQAGPRESLLNLLHSAEAASRVAVTVIAADGVVPSASVERYRAAVMAAPSLQPCVTLMIASSVYALLLPQLPDSVPPARGEDSSTGSSKAGSKSSHRVSSSSSSSGSGSTKAKGQSSASSSTSTARRGALPGWQVAYRERQKVPAMHQKLLHMFGCSTTAVLCATAQLAENEAVRGHRFLLMRQQAAWRLSTGVADIVAAAASHPLSDRLSPAAGVEDNATVQQQQQQQVQVQVLLPLLVLYWAAHRPASLSGNQLADCLFPIQTAQAAARLALALAKQSGQWLVPPNVREEAWQELLLLFKRISKVLLKQVAGGVSSMAGTTATSSALAASSSSSSSKAVCVSAAPAIAALGLLSCMCDAHSGQCGSTQLETDTPMPAALGAQQADKACQLLEVAVRCAPSEFLAQAPAIAAKLVPLGDDSSEKVAIASMSLDCSSSSSTASSNGTSSGSSRCLNSISLCFSLLKATSLQSAGEHGGSVTPFGLVDACHRCWYLLAAHAAGVLSGLAGKVKPFNSFSSLASSPALPAAASPHAAAAAVPWLVLLGRLLLQLDDQGPSSLLYQACRTGLAPVGKLLLDESIPEQVSAAKLDVAELVQQMTESSAGQAIQPATLRNLGMALTCLAFPYACNNPACSNLAGPQELQLVNGSSCICGGCRVARYCSRGCQRQHWKPHKPVCQAIAAAQAAEAAAEV